MSNDQEIKDIKRAGRWRRRFSVLLAIIIILVIVYESRSVWGHKLVHFIERHIPSHTMTVVAKDLTADLKLQQQIQMLAEQNQQLQSQQQAIQNQLRRLNAQDDNWALADATYLTSLANYQLLISHDPKTAVKLLQTADTRIASLNEPQYQKARQLLARNILQLQSLPALDVDGTVAQLMAISDQVPALSTLSPKLSETKSVATEKQYSSVWEKALHTLWHAIRSLVIIRHLDQPIAQLLTDDQQASVNQHLITLLQQAQWAVLHQNQKIYQSSLAQIQSTLSHYFRIDQDMTKAISENLKKLALINVEPNYPDISETVLVVQSLKASQIKVTKMVLQKSSIKHKGI